MPATLLSADSAQVKQDGMAAPPAAQAFFDYFRCHPGSVDFRVERTSNPAAAPQQQIPQALDAALGHVIAKDSKCSLPFDVKEVADYLRRERYITREESPIWKRLVGGLYYALRPAFPVAFRRHLQRAWLNARAKQAFPRWPVDCTVDHFFASLMRQALEARPGCRIPFVWFWPEGCSSCAIMTHDVETGAGLAACHRLMDVNDSFGIRSSFQLIPEARYSVTPAILSAIRDRGFEINVHDLKHDGHLYANREHFLAAAGKINQSALRFGSRGFRSGVLYRNQDWYDALQFSYDMSVPNAAHFDPQPGGCCTVMPYFVGDILELPVTTTQDYSLFHILSTYSLDLWREQIELIQQQHGLMSFIVHPDYLNTSKAMDTYRSLLGHLSKLRDHANLWMALPGELDCWWRQRHSMTLVPDSQGWRIEGPGAERAVLAYATLENGAVRYLFS